MKVLVTGAAGMLGAAVVDRMSYEKCAVVATARRSGKFVAMDIGDW